MKFSVANEHHKFFQNHHFIEFEEYLSPDQVQKLNQGIDRTIAQRLKTVPADLKWKDQESIISAGRDLWRGGADLKRLILQKKWAEVAADLTMQKALRLAFDQVMLPPKPTQKIKADATLNTMCCFQGLSCGLLICLDAPQSEAKEASILPKKPGNAVYFLPSAPLDLSPLMGTSSRYLLIAYGQPKTVYVLQENDPNTHYLKQLGYVFGDTLNDRLHPYVYR